MNDCINLLIEKYRPKTLDEIVLNEDVKEKIIKFKINDEIPHLLFCSKAGTGKTSLAKIIVNDILKTSYLYINASDENGIETIRSKVKSFSQVKSIDGKIKVIILDEFDGMSKIAQRALRNMMEEYSSNVRFILTANYKNNIIDEILSRTQYISLNSSLKEYFKRINFIMKNENINIEKDQLNDYVSLLKRCYPDFRRAIGFIDQCTKIVDDDKVFFINLNNSNFTIASEVFNKLKDKSNLFELRKFIIDNEINFANDYHVLLRDLFEVIYESDMEFEKKRKALILIEDYKMKHNIVLDKEINAYACVLCLYEFI